MLVLDVYFISYYIFLFLFSENVFGWRKPKVLLLMSAGGLQCHVCQTAGDSLPEEVVEKEGLKADELVPPLVKLMADGQVSNSMGQFRKYLEEEEPKFRPLGEKIHEWVRQKDGEERGGFIPRWRKTEKWFLSLSLSLSLSLPLCLCSRHQR